MRVRRVLAASLVVALLLGARGQVKAEPVTIHAGWLVVPNMIFPLMPMKPEVLRHYGKSYVLDLIHFTGTPPQITALSAGQIDLSPLSFSAFEVSIFLIFAWACGLLRTRPTSWPAMLKSAP